MDLKSQLLAERRAAYVRLQGGFPLPLAGTLYWATLAWAGTVLGPKGWTVIALWGSGLIFPLAIGLAQAFRNGFLKDRTAVTDLLLPAFVSMLLFFPMLIASLRVAPELAPLILAIGMSLHWPVIGWTYGRTGLYTAHALVRALVCFAIWTWLPEGRYTLLPASVALVYLATIAAIFVDLRSVRAGTAPA